MSGFDSFSCRRLSPLYAELQAANVLGNTNHAVKVT